MKMLVLLMGILAVTYATDPKLNFTSNFPRSCPLKNFSDWYVVGSYCVKYFGQPQLNFSEAEFFCRKTVIGGHMVSVHSEEANSQILVLTMKFNASNPRIWMGGLELFRTNRFIWTDGSDWNYDAWVPGQPDNTANIEDCVEMNWKANGKWNDGKCNLEKPFICAFKNRV
ncbi:lectin-like [Erpetoichthys calabaricus]|uniref:Lectin-like n=1 Tax=Erpetoichthys calabaricus TaxID=27687 RepID=A0A8C4SFT7_ERPCA|nr:lectin-like [Erpetoichthys calabaricus]